MSLFPGVSGAGAVPPSACGGRRSADPVLRWWNPLGAAAIDAATVYAYRAQASVGSPWGHAPANYAQTLRNWVNPGVNDLTEGNGVVPWVAATGWGFVAASLKYFLTGVVPTADQAYATFIQFANCTTDTTVILGVDNAAANDTFQIMPRFVGAQVIYSNGGNTAAAPVLNTGNLAIIGGQGYRNGIADGGAIPVWGNPSTRDIYIGCRNTGVPNLYVTANVLAVLICDDATAFGVADIAAIAAVGGSMHDL